MKKQVLKLLMVSLMLITTVLAYGQTEILNEAFSDTLMPPTGWSIDQGPEGPGTFGISYDTHAGGESPQGYLNGWPQSVGTARLISPVVDVSSYPVLQLEFKHSCNSAAWGTWSWKIETTSDGGATWNEVWSFTPTTYYWATTESVIISNEDSGSETFQFCLTYEANAIEALYHGYFDDFVLTGSDAPTAYTLPFTEDFSDGVCPAEDWTVTPSGTSNWQLYDGNSAGGTAPEGKYYGWPSINNGSRRMISPLIVTTGYESLLLEFKHKLQGSTSSDYSIKIETTSDGGGTWNEVYTVAPNGYWLYGVDVSFIIDNADVGSETFQFCITYTTTTYGGAYHYNFDDFSLTGVYTLPFSEDFSDEACPPANWEANPAVANWRLGTNNYAGGTAPEGYYYGWPQINSGTNRLITPEIATSGYESLELVFKHKLQGSTSSDYSIKIETTSDGGTTWNEVFTVTPNGYWPYGQEETIFIINDDVGSNNFQFCVSYSSTTYSGIYHYTFDDILLSGGPDLFGATFNIEDDEANPIEGAVIALEGNGTMTTNASGQAVFANLLPGTYAYDINSIGFQQNSGSVTLTDEDVVIDAMLEDLVFVPTSLDFDGDNEYVQTSYPGVLGAYRRTFQAWIYLDASSKGTKCILDYGANANGKRNTFMVNADGKLAYLSGTSNGNLTATDALVPLGSWVHVAFAFDGINGYLYQNGALVGTDALPGINSGTGTNLRIGERVSGGSINFKGMIDEVGIWNVALTQQEIINYACIDDPTAYNSLAAYYNFNEGAGTVLYDIKSGYNGTLMNMEDEDWVYNDGCEGKFYPKGWGGISSNVMLEEKILMEDLFAPVLDKMVILLGKDGIFWPGQNLNTLGNWDTYQGYKVKYNYAVDFVIEGAELTDRTVTLQPGTDFIPVLSLEPASVEDVLVPHSTDIEYVFDLSSQEIYWPTGGIVPGVTGALETLVPGYAYLALIKNTVTLDFDDVPLPLKSGTQPVAGNHFVNTTNWNDVTRTGAQHVISVTAANLDEGDVVGVFAADGTCTGMAQYNGVDEMLPLVVNGNDFTTTLKDGMIQDELMSFKIFRQGKEFDVYPVYNQDIANHDGLFAENGLSIIDDFKMGATSVNAVDALVFSVIPNPSNGQVKITMANSEACEISVMNMRGQEVYLAQANGSTFLNLSMHPAGVYFIRISNASSTSIQKIVIE